MGLFNWFKKSSAPSDNWKDAATKSGYGIDVPIPKVPNGFKICTHLKIDEDLRQELQDLLIRNCYSRSTGLVGEFLELLDIDSTDVFPDDLVELISKKHPRTKGERLMQRIAAVYIRHETSYFMNNAETDKYSGLKIEKVIIRTCEDQRVCSTCRKHANKKYRIDKAPILPMCWECRCFYSPVIK